MLKNSNFFEHIICPRFGKRHCLKLFLNLESERIFLQISLTTFSFLFRTAIITIPTAHFSSTPFSCYHRATLATTKKSGEWKIVRYFAMPRMRSHGKLFLHSFKQCRRKNWRKASGKIFSVMQSEAEICTIRQYPFHGSFAKWRSGLLSNTVVSQKLRQRNEGMCSFYIFPKRAHDDFRFHRIRFNIARGWIVHIPEWSAGQPFSSSQFLAHPSLNILLKVVRKVFTLSERHLQHKLSLRSWLK